MNNLMSTTYTNNNVVPATPIPIINNQSNTNNQSRSSTLNTGSLNCRSLSKISSPQSRQSFIRYLRSQSYDILTLQETHAEDLEIQGTLNIPFNTKFPAHGKGIWKANPQLEKDDYFVSSLNSALDKLRVSFPDTNTSNQLKWEQIKALVAKIALRFEQQISGSQEEIVENSALKAGKFWREKGELSSGFLKRSVATRSSQTYIAELKHPDTEELCTSPDRLLAASMAFYGKLYSPDQTCSLSTAQLLTAITPDLQISIDQGQRLTRPFNIIDLQEAVKRCPHHSSPGLDGIPYQILSIVFHHEIAGHIAVQIYNDALLQGMFPSSWQETCMVLLPKTGDLTLIKNWRPISLINADAKVFTRLLNGRLMPHMNRLISPSRLGFMPVRFIGENGKLLHVTMAHAEATSSTAIGLLLDQEKEYGCIHPDYLRCAMKNFGIPGILIDSLTKLFFSTSIRININGNISDSFPQRRGLRQGDPISPLLFNIAFDPFIRTLVSHPQMIGYRFTASGTQSSVGSPPLDAIKVLAYADDTLVLLSTPSDMVALQHTMSLYERSSNALLNYSKTQAFSLSGVPSPSWLEFLLQLPQPITSWHDRSSPSALIYLGYPVYSSVVQRNQFIDQLLLKVKTACDIHSSRSLSIRGRVAVLNTLIFSRLWHVLCVVPLTSTQIQKSQGIGGAFLNSYRFPRVSFATLCLPRDEGGAGTLDPRNQQLTLQWRWIVPLMNRDFSSPSTPLSVPYIRHCLFLLSGYETSHLWPLLLPAFRSKFTQLVSNPFKTLCQAFDEFPRLSHTGVLNACTCLAMPLHAALVQPEKHPLHCFTPGALTNLLPSNPGVLKLVINDIVKFDPETNHLRLRLLSEYQSSPRLARKVSTLLLQGRLYLSSFFLPLYIPGSVTREDIANQSIDLFPLCQPILSTISALDSRLRLKAFRTFLIAKYLTTRRSHNPTVIPQSWKLFWRLPLPSPARHTWFRLLRRTIPCKATLHSFLPEQHPSHNCTWCPTHIEDRSHFFFTCDAKRSLWPSVFERFFPDVPCLLYQIEQAVLSMDFSQLNPLSNPFSPIASKVSLPSLIGCVLQCIWSAHWLFVFNDIPFTIPTLCSSLDKMAFRLQNEMNFVPD
ncbi:hypothetical protein G6F56_005130 [Rhizopus delemar]|nr:hypothetical protein G6F56_005130 [Rhizopus delemar]